MSESWFCDIGMSRHPRGPFQSRQRGGRASWYGEAGDPTLTSDVTPAWKCDSAGLKRGLQLGPAAPALAPAARNRRVRGVARLERPADAAERDGAVHRGDALALREEGLAGDAAAVAHARGRRVRLERAARVLEPVRPAAAVEVARALPRALLGERDRGDDARRRAGPVGVARERDGERDLAVAVRRPPLRRRRARVRRRRSARIEPAHFRITMTRYEFSERRPGGDLVETWSVRRQLEHASRRSRAVGARARGALGGRRLRLRCAAERDRGRSGHSDHVELRLDGRTRDRQRSECHHHER